MKVISVVGARPQFVKAAPVSRALRERHTELLVHSGQHYDRAMSDVFFEQLGIPEADLNLGVGSGSHAAQTAEMLVKLEVVFEQERPDVVLVYGDTNTTLAGGLAAAKIGIPVAHVEAGLRSFNRAMPEEVNRVLVDHLSDILLCPTAAAVVNLAAEGITDGVELVGDVMLDTANRFRHAPADAVLNGFGLQRDGYYLATVHRASNSDSRESLSAIIEAFAVLDRPVLWAIHPRTTKNIDALGLRPRLDEATNIRPVPPVSYVETLALLQNASALLTDSGGMQKEAYFFGVPCVTLRDETEWVETVELGWNRLAGADTARIVAAVEALDKPSARPAVYGDGHAAEAIVGCLEKRYGGTV